MLKLNLENLIKTVESVCQRTARNTKKVKILLATKTRDIPILKTCIDLNYTYFAENRVQEFLKKKTELSGVSWDFIGHLQSKKAKEIVGQVALIHSVDRIKLADEINKRAGALKVKQKILIEVNTSGEKTKSGVTPDQVLGLLRHVLDLEHIEFSGLMTMATNTTDESMVRACFKKLYELREEAAKLVGVASEDLELSMGMSSDFQIAIEEGATIIRVGSIVFGAR